jgi:hypothetical protein
VLTISAHEEELRPGNSLLWFSTNQNEGIT